MEKKQLHSPQFSIWQKELVDRIEDAMQISQEMLFDPYSRDSKVSVQTLLDGLVRIRSEIFDGTLTPPDGVVSLGMTRFVSDWVDDLNGPLHAAVGKIEQHYLSGKNMSRLLVIP